MWPSPSCAIWPGTVAAAGERSEFVEFVDGRPPHELSLNSLIQDGNWIRRICRRDARLTMQATAYRRYRLRCDSQSGDMEGGSGLKRAVDYRSSVSVPTRPPSSADHRRQNVGLDVGTKVDDLPILLIKSMAYRARLAGRDR